MSTQYHVYTNGGSGGPVDYSAAVATVAGTSWSTPPITIRPSSWRFGVRAFDSVSGLEERNVDAAVALNLNAAGVDVTALPLAPFLVTATAGLGGAVQVDWFYPVSAARGVWKPTGFRVYAGTPSAVFTAAAAVVPYAARASFRAVLTGLTPGASHSVVVRTYNALGEETNVTAAVVVPTASGPAAVESLTAQATARIGDGRS